MNKTRSLLYRLARILGDLQAVKRGPSGIAKRIVRKKIYKKSGGWINKIFR